MRRSLPLYLLLAVGLLGLTACLGRDRATPETIATAASTPTPLPAVTTAPEDTAAPTATQTPLPATATAEPTSAPSATPPAPTAQPTVPPTPDPDEGVGALIYSDRLNGGDGWGWNFADEAASFSTADGRLTAVMHDPNQWWRFTAGPDTLAAADQQVRVTAHTAACAAADEYALMFRVSEVDGQYRGYVFKLRCDGAARVDRMDGSTLTPLVDWIASPAIKPGAAADNGLLVWMAGDQFRFYVNDQYLFSAQDDALAGGYYGFYVDDQSSGGLTVEFSNLVAKEVKSLSGGLRARAGQRLS